MIEVDRREGVPGRKGLRLFYGYSPGTTDSHPR